MRRSLKTARFVLAAGVLAGAGLWSLVLAVAEPAATAPIVLQYTEGPIFLGPHEHTVTAIAFSPDGKTVATGTGCLRLWDSASGRLKSVLAEDSIRGIGGLSFSPDGRTVATAGGLFGKEAVVWNTDTGRIAREILAQPGSLNAAASTLDASPFIYKGKPIVYRAMNAVAFSPDGRLLATAPDGVVLRDAPTGNVVATLKQPAKGVKAIAFSSDGKTLATASDDKKVRLWSVPAGVLEATFDGPTQPLNAVAISPDGKRIVATSSGNRSLFDKTPIGYLWSWERSGGLPRKTEFGNVNVRQVAFVAAATVVVGAGRDLLSVDLQGDDSTHPRKIWSHSQDVLAVAVSPDRRLVASGGEDYTVDIVEISTGKLIHRLPGLMDSFSSVATSSDGKRFATSTIDRRFSRHLPVDQAPFAARYKAYFPGADDVSQLQSSDVRIWSTHDGRLQSLLPLSSSLVTAIDFISQSDQMAVAGWLPGKGGMLSIWDLNSAQQVRDFPARAAEVLSIAVSPDGRTLASGDADGNFDLWDIQSGAKTRSHKLDHPVEAVTFSDDGKLLATGDGNRTVSVFDASSGTIVRTLKSRSYIESLDFSPDATLLAAGTREPGLELWELRADTPSRTLKASGDYFDRMPGFVAFSPDGRFVVCGGHGKDVAVFDAATGTLHCELRGHGHPATAAVFLPDGRLISGGEDRTLMLWDPMRSQRLATWVVVPADPKQNWGDEWVGFKPSGQFVASTHLDRLVGWQSGGEVIAGREDAERRQLVTSLFHADTSVAAFTPSKAGDEQVVAGIKLCWCPAGKFMMGSPANEPERRPGENQAEVTLTKGFWMGKYEVTQGDWKRVVGELPGEVDETAGIGDDFPVYNVNFFEAEEFCRRLTAQSHQSSALPRNWEFRLPTEAQWEYACRAGTTTATAFGDKLNSTQANFAGKSYNGANEGPSLKRATKVGSYPSNAWGLHDMQGNEVEWCRDWYHAKLPGGTDPDLSSVKGTPNRDGTWSRVRRGSAWGDDGWVSRSAFRQRYEPARRADHIGFRVVAVQN